MKNLSLASLSWLELTIYGKEKSILVYPVATELLKRISSEFFFPYGRTFILHTKTLCLTLLEGKVRFAQNWRNSTVHLLRERKRKLFFLFYLLLLFQNVLLIFLHFSTSTSLYVSLVKILLFNRKKISPFKFIVLLICWKLLSIRFVFWRNFVFAKLSFLFSLLSVLASKY